MKNAIIAAATRLAEKGYYTELTRVQIAREAKISDSAVSYYCGSMDDVRRDILKEALKTENYVILAQGLLRHDPALAEVSPTLRERILAAV